MFINTDIDFWEFEVEGPLENNNPEESGKG